MKVITWFMLVSLIQSISSCSCDSGHDTTDLFCNHPTWNAAMVTVVKITRDVPDINTIIEERNKEFELKIEEFLKAKIGEVALPTSPPIEKIKEKYGRSEREVEAVVEKVWGLGNMTVGQEITLWSHKDDGMCGVGRVLEPGYSTILWAPQHATWLDVTGCGIYRFIQTSFGRDNSHFQRVLPEQSGYKSISL